MPAAFVEDMRLLAFGGDLHGNSAWDLPAGPQVSHQVTHPGAAGCGCDENRLVVWMGMPGELFPHIAERAF